MRGRTRVRAACAGMAAVVGGLSGLILWQAAGYDRTAAALTLSAVLLAVALHEGGHIGAARVLGVPICGVRMGLFGIRLRLGGLLSYRQEGLIAAGGPAVNLLTALCLWPQAAVSDATWDGLFCLASVGLAAVNLLPVRGLDGGRILRCLLAFFFGDGVADGVLGVTTAVFLLLIWFALGYLLLRTGEEAGMFLFFSAMMLRALRERAPL